jgi:hypothetical protein
VSRPAESHRLAQHRSTGEMKFSRSQHDCSIEWTMLIFIGFPKKYSQKRTLFRQIPDFRDGRRLPGGAIWGWRGHNANGKLLCSRVSAKNSPQIIWKVSRSLRALAPGDMSQHPWRNPLPSDGFPIGMYSAFEVPMVTLK